METLDMKFWLQIITTLITVGTLYGKLSGDYATLKNEIKWMKEKLDRHNSFQDRLVRVEESSKSMHHRMDEHCEDERQKR